MEKQHNIELNCKGKCPKCGEGELLPFLRAVSTQGLQYGRGLDTEFDHYEVYYRCDHCNFHLEGDTFIDSLL
jgi:predicted nucleic-acid-binding Zn-ribbon protein